MLPAQSWLIHYVSLPEVTCCREVFCAASLMRYAPFSPRRMAIYYALFTFAHVRHYRQLLAISDAREKKILREEGDYITQEGRCKMGYLQADDFR